MWALKDEEGEEEKGGERKDNQTGRMSISVEENKKEKKKKSFGVAAFLTTLQVIGWKTREESKREIWHTQVPRKWDFHAAQK